LESVDREKTEDVCQGKGKERSKPYFHKHGSSANRGALLRKKKNTESLWGGGGEKGGSRRSDPAPTKPRERHGKGVATQ